MLDLTKYPKIAHLTEMNRYTHDYEIARHIAPFIQNATHYDFFRNMLIDPTYAFDDCDFAYDDTIPTRDYYATIAEFIQFALDDANEYFTEQITEIALSLSLCPLHRIDYAICFDDNDAECAQIRRIHPSHDT